MKGKPDITGFAPQKDPNAFLEGGAADQVERANTQATAIEPPRKGRGRVQKIFNFPEALADQLRDEAALRSRDSGQRVTEKDIVVAALESFFAQRR